MRYTVLCSPGGLLLHYSAIYYDSFMAGGSRLMFWFLLANPYVWLPLLVPAFLLAAVGSAVIETSLVENSTPKADSKVGALPRRLFVFIMYLADKWTISLRPSFVTDAHVSEEKAQPKADDAVTDSGACSSAVKWRLPSIWCLVKLRICRRDNEGCSTSERDRTGVGD